jgi:hypothetical protein
MIMSVVVIRVGLAMRRSLLFFPYEHIRPGRLVRFVPKGDIGRYLAIRQPNSTTAAPTAAAMTDVTIPPLSASSPPM